MRMMMFLYVLFKMKLLSPAGLYRLLSAVYVYGINLAALLKLAASTNGNKVAVTDDRETLTFKQLLERTERLAVRLMRQYAIGEGSKVGFLCKNHVSLVESIFAVSLAGSDIYLLNAEMSGDQFGRQLEMNNFDLLIYDAELASFVDRSGFEGAKLISYHDVLPSISGYVNAPVQGETTVKRQRASSGRLMLLTGGTTGKAKQAAHKPSMFNYLAPFATMLRRLRLLEYNTVYIATPIYHGYGIAILLLFTALGKKIVIKAGFNAEQACRLIKKHEVEVVTVVPLMIDKMLKANAGDLKSLACIASGGAELSPRLAAEVSGKLGDVLYNLYGTSECGLISIATPKDLNESPGTVGRLIKGVRLHVLGVDKRKARTGEIGQLCILNSRSIWNRKQAWIDTGDIGFKDERGFYYLKGRADDMIVSAGENVYPSDVEHILLQHPFIEDAAVVGIRDEQFGQRLKAVVQPARGAKLSAGEIGEWLRPRAARYQMPKEIVLVEQMPYTPVGKRNKKQLI